MSNVIYVKSSDSKIWDIEKTATEIVYKLSKYNNVVIDFNFEAPDISCTELKAVLDYLADQGVSYNQIEIHTGNLLESYNKFKIIKHSSWMTELANFKRFSNLTTPTKQITKHFGCFIGRSNINRLLISSHLAAKYSNKTLMTYHYTPGNDYHRAHNGLEDILYYFGPNSQEFIQAVELIQKSPIKNDQIEYSYPIDRNFNTKICDWYKNIFVDVVCETFSNGNVFFLTEKFWRPIVTKTPFIIQGPQFTLKRLKQLGFQTFDRWWDEGYDEDPYLHSQKEIKKIFAYLEKFSIGQLTNMYNDMQSVLDNNYNCMMNLTYEDLNCVK
jgi:uncharacterized protein YktA (UPF0223 family)